MAKFQIGYCELYLKNYHDMIDNPRFYLLNDPKFLITFNIEINEFYSYQIQLTHYPLTILRLIRNKMRECIEQLDDPGNDTNIQNIENVFKSKLYIYPQIIEEIFLPTGESTCIIHTYKLCIIQRKWKKYYLNLKQKIYKLRNPRNLFKRQIRY